MITLEALRSMALSFAEATEELHMEKTSFRIRKKIFATYDASKHRAVLKLNEVDQSVFADGSNGTIQPVPGGWGRQGWTMVDLNTVHLDLFKDALTTAYCIVAPKKLATQYSSDSGLL